MTVRSVAMVVALFCAACPAAARAASAPAQDKPAPDKPAPDKVPSITEKTQGMRKIEVNACSDPDDNRVLECALECHASHIVTGDAALLELDPFQQRRIVRAASFLAERPWADVEPAE